MESCCIYRVCKPAIATMLFFVATLLSGAFGQDDCIPTCVWDSVAGGCFVNRGFMARLLRTLEGDFWSGFADQLVACDALGRGSACNTVSGCELNELSQCAVGRRWAQEALLEVLTTSPQAAGGEERCGLFGGMLAQSLACGSSATAGSCEARGSCTWSTAQGTCEVSREGLIGTLLPDMREPLARLNMLRLHCASVTSAVGCPAGCRWVNASSLCLLDSLQALLTVIGEDCPFRDFFTGSLRCMPLSTAESCEGLLRSDGMRSCRWRDGVCEPLPTSTEYDIVRLLAPNQPFALENLLAADEECTATSENDCGSGCSTLIAP
eukprot:CAMPEP_0178418640 /NCGR_PEP_ID=MMETSP0689_2-20121128/25194_1 /TAXON_ID=160604 /ORGANISM="Amphidinium massartii, Strain CS-259" /LENGTH=322 /DNA_ID=CAMNT_0020040043 /DNA_START=12 /DNA_END=976 /DNA_ORIENTATION=+